MIKVYLKCVDVVDVHDPSPGMVPKEINKENQSFEAVKNNEIENQKCNITTAIY